MSDCLFSVTIPGRPIVKKNTQRVFGTGRGKRVVYGAKYRLWESKAMAVCFCSNRTASINTPMLAIFRFFFENRQAEADVSNLIEGPSDMLKRAGVIKDDRLFRRIIAEKFFGETARTEIELYEYAEEKTA